MVFLIGSGSRLQIVSAALEKKGIGFHVFEVKNGSISDHLGQSLTEKEAHSYICQYEYQAFTFFCNYPKRLACDWSECRGVILHGGPVPRYRGASVINWQILNSEDYIELSLLKFSRDFDKGDVIATRWFATDFAALDEVRPRIDVLFSEMVLELISSPEKYLAATQQQGDECYWHKRIPEDMEFSPKHDQAAELIALFKSSEKNYRPFFRSRNNLYKVTKLSAEDVPGLGSRPGTYFELSGQGYLAMADRIVKISVEKVIS